MTNFRRAWRAAAVCIAVAGAALAQAPSIPQHPAGVWGRLDWDDLLLRFAIGGMLVFFCNMVCSLLSHTFSGDDHTPQVRHHLFRSFLHRGRS